MTTASASSLVAADPAVNLPPKGADDSISWLSASYMAVREHRERRKASLGTTALAGRIIYDYTPTPTITHGRTPENTENNYPRAV
jgi:hypothetical protein